MNKETNIESLLENIYNEILIYSCDNYYKPNVIILHPSKKILILSKRPPNEYYRTYSECYKHYKEFLFNVRLLWSESIEESEILIY